MKTKQRKFIRPSVLFAIANVVVIMAGSTHAHEWSDKTGHYKFTGDLIARNDKTVIIETDKKKLISVKIEKLSEADHKYLAEQLDKHTEKASQPQTWHLRGGLKINAAVVEYGQRTVSIQRRRGKAYVNDKRFDNLPEFYQKLIPKIISHVEKSKITSDDLRDWLLSKHGHAMNYTLDGVMLEFENGDLYVLPFFMFSDEDRKLLEPGWKSWLAAENDRQLRKDHELELQAKSIANREKEMAARRVQELHLQLEAYRAGLFDLWEVSMQPSNGIGPWRQVIVPGRDSNAASVAALQENPGYTIGGVAMMERRNY